MDQHIKTGALLAGGAIAVGLIVGGVFIFLLRDSSPQASEPPVAPLDVAAYPGAASGASAVDAAPAKSSLDMVGKIGGAAGPGASAAPLSSPLEQAAQGFRDAIRGSEKTLSDLARDYTKRYPVIQQYGRDWMSYPDLKALNDDYMRDHDPIAFLRGLAASPSFPKLLQKYAGQPAIQSFVRDCFTKAPPGAVATSMDYLTEDKTLDTFVTSVAERSGLPPALLQVQAPADGSAPDISKIAAQALRQMPVPAAAAGAPDGRRR